MACTVNGCPRITRIAGAALQHAGLACKKVAAEFHPAVERYRGEMGATHALAIRPRLYAWNEQVRRASHSTKQRVVNLHGANFQAVRVVLGAEVQQLKKAREVIHRRLAVPHSRYFTHARREFYLAECRHHGMAVRHQELKERGNRRDENERRDQEVTNICSEAIRASSGTRTNVYVQASGSHNPMTGGSQRRMLYSSSGNKFRSAYAPATALK